MAVALVASGAMVEYSGCKLLTSGDTTCGELLVIHVRELTGRAEAPFCCDYSEMHGAAAYIRTNYVYIPTNSLYRDDVEGMCESIVTYNPLDAAWCRKAYVSSVFPDMVTEPPV